VNENKELPLETEMDWEVRACEPDDHEAVAALLRKAFDSDAEARLVQALRDGGDAEIELVADAEGELLGYMMLSRMAAPDGSLGLGPVATASRVRRQGVAASLIESGLALATANDWHTAFVLGDLDYYGRFGFEAAPAKRFVSPYAGPHFGLTFLDEDAAPKSGRADYAPAFAMFE
jgi:putative acetyltransferase